MAKITKEQKARIYCVKHGHAKFVTMCFGYVYCGRCGDQIGDRLGGFFNMTKIALVGHDCKQCRAIVKTLSKSDQAIWKKLNDKEKKERAELEAA